MSRGVSARCPDCNAKLTVPPKLIGKTAACPRCQRQIMVLESAPAPYPLSTEAAEKECTPNLIHCVRCSREIAVDASQCPTCGAPNHWQHPEITRFIENKELFDDMPAFQTQRFPMILKGHSTTEQRGAKLSSKAVSMVILGLALSAFGLWVIGGPLLIIAAIMMLVSSLRTTDPSDTFQEFSIDFSQSPPHWYSNDDEFWKPVKAFFDL